MLIGRFLGFDWSSRAALAGGCALCNQMGKIMGKEASAVKRTCLGAKV